MSKFVAIIDDENYTCPMEHEGHCHIAWNKIYKCMEDCDGILNARPEFCPLKEYKDAIPVEWLEKMWERDKDGFTDEYGEYHDSEGSLGESCQHVLENWRTNYRWKWEKENE